MSTKPALSIILFGAGFFFFSASSNATSSKFAEFLIFEDDSGALIHLSETRPESFHSLSYETLDQTFDFLFLKRRRDDTRRWVLNNYRSLNCSNEAVSSKRCEYFKQLWLGPLKNTFFFDASLVQLSKARELLVFSDKTTEKARRDQCTEARGILAELVNREGAMKLTLEGQMDVFECLGDESGRLEVYQILETLRDIDSAFGT
jgi:hypothetical protein